MYRTAASRLRALKARAGNRSITRFASASAVATKSSSSGGFFSWLTGLGSSSLPPLQVPLQGVTIPPPLPDYVEPGKVKITTLPNGVKIASKPSVECVNPAASIGFFIWGHTPRGTYGFKSTTNRSHFRIVREVEEIGGNVAASASREQMGYTYDALKVYAPEMVELLIDCMRNPVFMDWEVNEQLQKVKAEIAEASNNPQGLLLEAIHSAEPAIDRLDCRILEEFVAENYTARWMVLAASGVEHEELLKIAEPLLSDLPSILLRSQSLSMLEVITVAKLIQGFVSSVFLNYSLIFLDAQKTHFTLAFEAPGGWHKEKEAMVLTVLQMLMGGGGSFSAGGPGKGMYSRLYLCVLNKYPQIHSFSAFNSIYNHTGLFGIHATTSSDFVSKAIDIAVKELIAVATPGEVDQVQLDCAKQLTKFAILMNLESRMIVSEDIGRQVLTYEERIPVEHFLKVVDEVSAKDIASVARKLISSPLTMASYGDVIYVPSYDTVSSKFHSK
ncbi:hypothetical protein ACSBR2_038435 [Camellia fascicularis]